MKLFGKSVISAGAVVAAALLLAISSPRDRPRSGRRTGQHRQHRNSSGNR